jgi:predicted TIM-barrel fold metal-dependent hydrolase
MLLTDYRPQPRLVTKTTLIAKPKFPVIDAHNHLFDGWDKKPVSQLLDHFDEAGIACYVDLDGGWGEDVLNYHLDRFKQPAPDRFKVFGGVDWSKWIKMGDAFPEWAAGRLRVQKERGAEGLKIWKILGLKVSDHNGQLVKVDDPRLGPIWQAAGELDLPITIHIGDPVAFFDPLDESNERWEELGEHPDWAFPSPPFPPFLEIVNGLANVVTRYPQTTFIGAHVGCYAENLGWVSKLLKRCPNFYVDISARISELGRQPYTARRFFLEHADRILFGTDMMPDVATYRIYYRFLETDDEYFAYHTTPVPDQGRWNVCGLYLPDNVLEKVYHKNAGRILFGTD